MKASLKFLSLCLLLLVPLSAAHAQAPLLSPIGNVSLNAGSTMNVNVVAVDEYNRPITITAALPPFATLNTPTIATGVVVTSLTLAPSSAFIGDYTAAVTATAGGVSSVRVIQITVNATGSNQAPRVTAPPLREVTAESALSFAVTASDADGDGIESLSASGLPAGATFTLNGSNTAATFNWTPGAEDAGEYDVEFTASNMLSATAVTHIRVASPPTLGITPIDDVTVEGGGSISVPVQASGVPGALITLTGALPTFATLNPPGTGTGAVNTTVTVSPPVGSAGTYHASITATSVGVSVTEDFDIIVTGSGGGDNRAPVLTAPVAATVAVGSTLSFDVTATDPDGDHVDLFGSALPPGSSFLDHGNDTGTFTWSPVSGQAGTYTASFTGLDNRGGAGSASTLITVTGGTPENHAPTLSAPATEQVDEGVNVSFTVTASDQDGDHVALSASVPAGATFTDQGDNTGTFSWTPGSTQSGTYVVAFLGNDGNGGTGTASTTITVMDVGGGGDGEVPGKACLIGGFKTGWFKTGKGAACFRIKPVNRSFDVRDVVLSSIRLRFHGESVAALDGARIDLYCRGNRHDASVASYLGAGHDRGKGRGKGRGGDDDDDDGDDHDKGNNACSGVRCNDHGDCNDPGHDDDDDGGRDDHGRDHDHGDDDDDDGGGHDHGDDDRYTGRHRGGACDTLGIRVCFSTEALRSLFAGANLPCALVDAEILATLTNGATVVATFNGSKHKHDDGDDRHGDDDDGDDDHGDDDDDDGGSDGIARDEDLDREYLSGHGKALGVSAKPNPLNPKTELSFTMSREGRVRVVVYDMQGRLVKTLLNDFRVAGQQRLTWDGSNEGNVRMPSGVYFIRIQAPEASVIHRVTVLQ